MSGVCVCVCVCGLLMEYPTAWDSQQQQKNKRDMEEKKEGEEERGNIKARMKINGKNEAWGLAESERCRKGDRWSIGGASHSLQPHLHY